MPLRILVVNDDGPPSSHSSPYVHSLVRELQAAGHEVCVCLPNTQRSWIGKAHMIGQTVKPVYYRPPRPGTSLHPAGLGAADDASVHGSTHARPLPDGSEEEWVLVDGTPASCVQIGLYHFFGGAQGAFDVVVSGPNYGRNTTAMFALSSGTLGGALEAAACGKKAIALSYAFFSRNHDPEIVAGASRHSVKVIEALTRQWPSDGSVDVYSVNVPLVENVESAKTIFAPCLQNYWTPGMSAFEAVDADDVEDKDEEEERIRQAEINASADGKKADGNEDTRTGHKHRHFKWAPQLGEVMKATNEAPSHVDGQVVRSGNTSVTALKANFWHAATHLHEQELQLTAKTQVSKDTTELNGDGDIIYAIVDYEDRYVQPIIVSALQALILPERLCLLPPTTAPPSVPKGAKFLQIRAYESIDFDHAMANPSTSLVNSYIIRKALIRKHFLSTTVDHWVAKHPESVLRDHVKRAEAFEVDYAEFLDDSLVEAFDLRASLERNEALGAQAQAQGCARGATSEGHGDPQQADSVTAPNDPTEREWWILKPSMSDRGQGIRLFSTMDELQGIFDGWGEDEPSSDEDNDKNDDHEESEGKDYITTSHLRHFVAQPYIHPPLLLPSCANRKFHIRTYVLCAGAMRVYVGREMLALFAAKPYAPPGAVVDGDVSQEYHLDAHLTNTCLQGPRADALSVQRFWELDMPPSLRESIFARICDISGEIFEAAARGMMVHFQPLPFAFEVFGLDFLVDAGGSPWLLEVNAFPDFKQTGDRLREQVVEEFWKGAVRWGLGAWAGLESDGERGQGDEKMVLIRTVDLGRR